MEKYNIRISLLLDRWKKPNGGSLGYSIMAYICNDTYLVFDSKNSPMLNRTHSNMVLNINTLRYLSKKQHKYEFDK